MKKYKVEVKLEYVGTGDVYSSIQEVDAHNDEEAMIKAELIYEAPLQPVHVLGSRIVEVIG